MIAFDCPTGPREIIVDKENGLLIENQNIDKLTEGMNAFIVNEALYLKCKSQAKASIIKFNVESIGNQWLELINNI